MIQETKLCRTCQRVLPTSMFYQSAVTRDRLQANCKDCKGAMQKAASARVNELSRRTYAAHKEVYLKVRADRRAVMDEADIVHDASFQERYWQKVDDRNDDGCWEWQAHVTKNGYGQIGFRGGIVTAHRAAWILTNGPIPDGLYVCHHCDDRKCCNPDHMFLGTFEDNMRDMVSKGRQNRPIGEKHPKAILTWDKVREIRARYKAGNVIQRDLAVEYGVSTPTIAGVVRNYTWVDPEYVPLPSRKG